MSGVGCSLYCGPSGWVVCVLGLDFVGAQGCGMLLSVNCWKRSLDSLSGSRGGRGSGRGVHDDVAPHVDGGALAEGGAPVHPRLLLGFFGDFLQVALCCPEVGSGGVCLEAFVGPQ